MKYATTDLVRLQQFTGISKEILSVIPTGHDFHLSEAAALANYFTQELDLLLKVDLEKKSALKLDKIKFLVFDVDGVLTNAQIYYSEKGDELKSFNTRDGLGLREAVKKGYKVGFLSHGITTNIIRKRTDILHAHYYYMGNEPKLDVLNGWLEKENLSFDEVLFMGDDINDLEVMKCVGVSVCPADAVIQIKREVDIILTQKSGQGAVRELMDNYLSITIKK